MTPSYGELVKQYARTLVDLCEHTMGYAQHPSLVRHLYWLEGRACEALGHLWDQDQFDDRVMAEVDTRLVELGIQDPDPELSLQEVLDTLRPR